MELKAHFDRTASRSLGRLHCHCVSFGALQAGKRLFAKMKPSSSSRIGKFATRSKANKRH